MMLTNSFVMLYSSESFASLENKTWDAINLLRGQVEIHDFHLITFLLFLQKEGVLDSVRNKHAYLVKNELRDSIFRIEGERLELVRMLYDAFYDALEKVSVNSLYELICLFGSLDKASLDRHFGDLVESLIFRLAKSEGRFGGEYLQPLELTKFICALANPKEGASVYNPFGGLASFGIYFDKCVEYTGEEFNKRSWAIGMIRLIAKDKATNSDFILGNSISNWNSKSKRYDLIVANPPFNVKLSKVDSDRLKYDYHGFVGTKPLYYDSFLINKSLVSLKEGGKAVFVLPIGFLSNTRPEYLSLRTFLVENDLVETVISFPGGLLSNTNLPFCLVVLNKTKQNRREILFVDAEASVKEVSKNDKEIDSERLFSVVSKAKRVLSEGSNALLPEAKLVSIDEVIISNFNFSVRRYVAGELPGVQLGEYSELGELIKPIKGAKVKEPIWGKFVRIRDLNTDKIDYKLKLDELQELEVPKHALKLEKSALLLSIRWKSLKPTYFEYKGESVFISPDIVAYEVNNQLVDVAYLVYELAADYITNQLDRYRTGATIPFISKQDLVLVNIDLPSLSEQRAKIKGIREEYVRIQVIEAERNAIAHGVLKKQFDEFASLKHTLGTPRQNILSFSEALISFFENNSSGEFRQIDNAFTQELGQDMVSVFKAIRNDISFISELLEKGEDGLVLENYSLSTVPLLEVQRLISQFLSTPYKFKLELRPLKGGGEENLGIHADLTLFKVILDNILTNANKHGFDEKRVENEVIIDLSVIDNLFVLDIKNNGKPFRRNFDKKKFIAKFSTADSSNGSGLGGYDINRIVEYFNGTWDLILNEDEMFPVMFNFKFPVTIIK